ncbi:nuclear receptor subfamily 2 group C member 1 isoform X2 [Sigmodon hispidus]
MPHLQLFTENSQDQGANKVFDLCVVCGDKASAVQCERKPIEVSREKSSNCAASTEKIYIRKDLRSPLAATPTFVTDGSETTRSTGMLDSGMFVNVHQSGIKTETSMLMTPDKVTYPNHLEWLETEADRLGTGPKERFPYVSMHTHTPVHADGHPHAHVHKHQTEDMPC